METREHYPSGLWLQGAEQVCAECHEPWPGDAEGHGPALTAVCCRNHRDGVRCFLAPCDD